jgi:ATP-dependent Lon protease
MSLDLPAREKQNHFLKKRYSMADETDDRDEVLDDKAAEVVADGGEEDGPTDRSDDPASLMDEAEGDEAGETLVLASTLFPPQLPVIPINNRPLFPKMMVPMMIDDAELVKMLVEHVKEEPRYVALVLRRDAKQDSADEESLDLHEVGVIAEVLQLGKVDGVEAVQVMLGVLERCRLTHVLKSEPYLIASVEYLLETESTPDSELKAYAVVVIKSIKELIQLNPLYKEELGLFMQHSSLQDPGRLADFAAALTTSSPAEMQDILGTISVLERLRKVILLLKKEIEVSQLQVEISKDIEQKMSTNQREFFMREQLKFIKKELGIEKEGQASEVERFEKRLESLTLPEEAQAKVDEELDKLRLLEPASPEFNVTRSYLDWLTVLPWGVFSEDNYDIAAASKILDRDHYGLEDVKDRILEFLSVGILKGNIAGSILCFVGPPGVGKTSIGKSIAESIGRSFYRFSVGGMRDEAEIKGHRRTYIGAMPGKFLQAIKVCKSSNAVIMLDEVDKIGASYHGDPASSLLEVLDPEQNCEFLDHYLDVRFDLSNVFFVCTANQVDTIPRPLLDRMEVIHLSGYILKEKLEIARRFLIPKQLKAHGLKRRQFKITAKALRAIIDGYAREPGVRGLEKHLKRIMRKCVKRIVSGDVESVKVDAPDVVELLGQPIFSDEDPYQIPQTGVVMGLAWTSMGGDTLHIEATSVHTGKAGFKQTGQLGDVMVESSEIAYTYIRSTLETDQQRDFFNTRSIHLHVPAGATPKDGPSAGVTMATALYSLVEGKPLKERLAMTGELTLTGLVMPIGGLKEKTIAAKRANVKTLIFPHANRKDFDELPAHIRKGITPHFVRTFDEVKALCF